MLVPAILTGTVVSAVSVVGLTTARAPARPPDPDDLQVPCGAVWNRLPADLQAGHQGGRGPARRREAGRDPRDPGGRPRRGVRRQGRPRRRADPGPARSSPSRSCPRTCRPTSRRSSALPDAEKVGRGEGAPRRRPRRRVRRAGADLRRADAGAPRDLRRLASRSRSFRCAAKSLALAEQRLIRSSPGPRRRPCSRRSRAAAASEPVRLPRSRGSRASVVARAERHDVHARHLEDRGPPRGDDLWRHDGLEGCGSRQRGSDALPVGRTASASGSSRRMARVSRGVDDHLGSPPLVVEVVGGERTGRGSAADPRRDRLQSGATSASGVAGSAPAPRQGVTHGSGSMDVARRPGQLAAELETSGSLMRSVGMPGGPPLTVERAPASGPATASRSPHTSSSQPRRARGSAQAAGAAGARRARVSRSKRRADVGPRGLLDPLGPGAHQPAVDERHQSQPFAPVVVGSS